MDHIDNWKNRNVFIKQAELNRNELNGAYPAHWNSFIRIVKSIEGDVFSLLDVGCGTGAYYELCRRNFNLEYFGIDYSEDAIEIAKEIWSCDRFTVKDFKEIEIDFVEEYDMIHMGALLDVLPNANEALDFILKLGVGYVLISRVEISDESRCDTYVAYGEIVTYKYLHGQHEIRKTIEENGYEIEMVDGNNILLKKSNG